MQNFQKQKKRKPKFANVRCEADGIKFDSKKERKRYYDLQWMEKAGEIRNVVVHPKFEFPFLSKAGNKLHIKPDFSYERMIRKGVHLTLKADDDGLESWDISTYVHANLSEYPLNCLIHEVIKDGVIDIWLRVVEDVKTNASETDLFKFKWSALGYFHPGYSREIYNPTRE